MLPQYTTIVPTIIFLDNHFDFIRLLSIAAVALQNNLVHTFLPYLTISYHIMLLKLSPFQTEATKTTASKFTGAVSTANTRHSSTQKRPSRTATHSKTSTPVTPRPWTNDWSDSYQGPKLEQSPSSWSPPGLKMTPVLNVPLMLMAPSEVNMQLVSEHMEIHEFVLI